MARKLVPASLLAAGLACLVGCAQTSSVEADAFETLVSDTRQTIHERMAEHAWPGVAIAIVDRDRVLWSETFGYRDTARTEPVTSHTVFNIASISKTVVAIAVMLAAQDGLVELDTPVVSYLPGFGVNSRWEENPERRITLRHLLNHTSGLTHEAPVGNNYAPESPSWAAHLASISDTWLKFPVGERYAYSNLGIETASHIVQEVSGTPFAAFVQTRIFEPLGMQSSFVNTRAKHGNCDACATGHSRWFERLPTYIPMEGAGGFRMTLDDAVRYLQFHLNRGRVGDREILAPQFFDEMHRPSVQIASFAPMLRGGLARYLWGDFAETYSVQHTGSGFGFSAVVRWYPEYGIGMAMFLNTINPGADWDVGTPLLKAMIEQGVVSKPHEPSGLSAEEFFRQVEATTRRHPLSDPGETPYQAQWEPWLGRYCAVHGEPYLLAQGIDRSPVCFRVFEQDGYLYHDGGLHHSGSRTQRLVEHQPGLFFTEISGEAVDFRQPVPRFRSVALQKTD